MLGCMTPNGVIQATALQITEALGCSQHHAAGILARLSAKTWQNYPVVVRVTREAAPSTYSLSHALLLHSERVEVQPDGPHTSDSEVVHYSRTRYALPRQAVEPMVLAQLGLSPDEASRSKLRELRRKLLALGVDPQTIDRLIATYPSSSIAQQLAWLPLRHPHHPGRYVVAAIESNYAAPGPLREIGSDYGSDVEASENQPDPAASPEGGAHE